MLKYSWRAGVSLLVLAVFLQTGCGRPKAVATDPDRARTTLLQALDAWKGGETLDGLASRAAITVVDSAWKNGMRLVAYEIVGNGQMDGFDWQLRAKLSLADDKGNKSEERAIYAVSISPKMVIVRAEAGGG
jgi:hypothetical protein